MHYYKNYKYIKRFLHGGIFRDEYELIDLWISWGYSNDKVVEYLKKRRLDIYVSDNIYNQLRYQVNEGVINYGEKK